LKTKSLLPSLYPPGQRPLWVGDKREELPLFGRRPIGAPSGAEAPLGRRLARRAKRGKGRFSEQYVFSIMDSLVI